MKKTMKNAISSLTAKLAAMLLAFTCVGSAWGASDTSWYDADQSSFTLTTEAQLRGLAQLVNAGNSFSGKTITLGADIDVGSEEWVTIATSGDSTKFAGTFDGGNHVISNLVIDQSDETPAYRAAGFFGAISGTVKNLKFVNASVTGISLGRASDGATVNGVAVAVGSMAYGGTIDNVSVENATVLGNRYVAGIVGYAKGTVQNCTIKNVTIVAEPDKLTGSYDNGDKAGGIVGYCNGAVTIKNNTIEGDFSIRGYRDIGGIVGCGGSGTTLESNSVADDATVSVTVDQVTGNYGSKTPNAGVLAGRVNGATGTAGATIEATNEISASATTSTETAVAVAQIGTTQYGSLDAATRAYQSGDTIELVGDVSSMTAPEGWVINAGTPPTLTVDPFTTYTKVADGFYQSGTTYDNSTDFYITNLNGLKFFRDLVNGETAASYAYFEATGVTGMYPTTPAGIKSFHSKNMFSGKTVHLCEDVDLAGEQWITIGFNRAERTITDPDTSASASVSKCTFYGLFDAGIYDGDGNLTGTHVISNLDTSWQYVPEAATIQEKYQLTGLFGQLSGGTTAGVKNLTVRNATVVGRTDVGVIAGRSYNGGAKIENCHVVGNVNVTGTGTYVGGLVGECRGSIVDSSVDAASGSSISGLAYVGGLAGSVFEYNANDPVEVSGSAVSNATVSASYSGAAGVGALVGVTSPSGTYHGNVVISGNDANNVSVTAPNASASSGAVGTLVGYALYDNGAYAILTDNTVSGTTSATAGGETVTAKMGAANDNIAVGANVTFDESGKVTGGIFEVINEELIASGYMTIDNPDTETSASYPLTIGGPYVAVIYDENNALVGGYETLKAAFEAVNGCSANAVTINILQDVATSDWTSEVDLEWTKNVVIDTPVAEGVTVNLNNLNLFVEDGKDMEIGAKVTISTVGQIGSYTGNNVVLNGDVNAVQFYAYRGSVNVTPSSKVTFHYDGQMGMWGGASINIAGDLADALNANVSSITPQLSGGYIKYFFGNDSVSLKDTFVSTTWIVGDNRYSNYEFDLTLDNSILQLTGSGDKTFNFLGQSTGTISLKGSRIIANSGTVTINASDTVNMDWKSSITAKNFTNTGKIVLDMAGFDGTLPLTLVSTTDADAQLGDFEVINNASGATLMIDANGNIVAVEAVAQIGDKQYGTLEAAIAAAQSGDTVKLLKDVAVNTQINLPVPVTIDLNGKTITSAADNRVFKIATTVGEYTFKNGTVNTTNPCYGLFRVDNASTVTVEGITATNDRSWGCNFRIAGGAQVLVTNCTITATNAGGIYAEGGSIVDVYDCTIAETGTATDCNASAFAIGEGATLTVHSGTYSGEYGAFVCSSGGTIEILDGSVTGRKYALESDARVGGNEDNSIADSLIKVSGGTIDGELHEENQVYSGTLTYANKMLISGGTFLNYSATGPTADNAGYEISGGLFDHQVLAAHCAEGYVPTTTADENGMYTVTSEYDAQIVRNGTIVERGTLAAMAAAVQAGDTVQLLRDVANAGAVTFAAPATFEPYPTRFALSGEVTITLSEAGGTVQDIDFSDVKPSRGTIESVISATPAADAVFTITGNTFTTPGAVKQILIEAASATDFTATITGNAFNAGSKTTRAFAVVNAADADKLTLDGNYIADSLWFGASADGANVSEKAYPQLAAADAAEATVTLPTFIIKKNAADGKPMINGYATLAAATDGAATGDTIFVTGDATLDAAVTTSKNLTIDGQDKTLTASGDWSLKGVSLTLNGVTTTGNITLQNITLKYDDADTDYTTARLGGNVTLGENVTIDASAVADDGAIFGTGVTVAAGATPTLKVGDSVAAGQTLISSLTLGENASVGVTGLPTGLYDAIADGTLALRTQEAKVTVGEMVTYYNTLQEALNAVRAANADATLTLLDDVKLSGTETVSLNVAYNCVIDGNGHSITPAADAASVYSRFDFGMPGQAYSAAKNYVVTNLTISGFSDSTYFIRAEGCSLTFAGCTISNNTLAAQANSRVLLGTASDITLSGCTFANNTTAAYMIDYNTNGSANGEPGTLNIDNCLFANNTCAGTGLIYTYGSANGGDLIANSTFVGNTVTSAAAAVIYFSGATDVEGCLFTNNTVTCTDATQKCGVLALGSGAKNSAITGNVFVDNTLASTGTKATVYAGAENANLGGNYWGDGEVPETGDGKDIYLAKSGVSYESYATSYALNAEGNGATVVTPAIAEAYDAEGGTLIGQYSTVNEAIAAEGATYVKLLDSVTLTSPLTMTNSYTLDFNGKTIYYNTTASTPISRASTIVFKDGKLDISGAQMSGTAAGNDIFSFAADGNTLTFGNMDLYGDGYSGYSVFWFKGNNTTPVNTLNFANGSTIELKNEANPSGGVFKGPGAYHENQFFVVNIIDSTVTCTDVVRFSLYGTVNVKDSTVTFTGGENAFRQGAFTFDHSTVTVSGAKAGEGKGIVPRFSDTVVTNGSVLTFIGSNIGKDVLFEYANNIVIYDTSSVTAASVSGAAADRAIIAPPNYSLVTTDNGGESVTYSITPAVARIGNTYYATFEDAVEAYQEGDTITVVGYDPGTMVPPNGWVFLTDGEDVTTLVRALAQTITVNGATATTNQYASLEEAIAASASGDTVELLSNYTMTNALRFARKSVTLDLGGNTLKVTANQNNLAFGGVTTTITNGVIDISGVGVTSSTTYIFDAGHSIVNGEGASAGNTINISDVTITGKDYYGYSVFGLYNNCALNIENSTVGLTNCLYTSGGFVKSDAAGYNVPITIKNSTIDLVNTQRIAVDGDIAIIDSTIRAVDDRAIAGDTVAKLDNGFNQSGLAITNSSVTISGGTGRGVTLKGKDIVVADGSALAISDMDEGDIMFKTDNTITATGDSHVTAGTVVLTTGTTKLANELLIAEDNSTVPTFEAQIGRVPYAKLGTAVNAAQAGDTVVLLKDVETTSVIMITKSLTIDGGVNTNKITTSTATRVFRVQNSNNDVTFKNVEITSTGAADNDKRGISIDSPISNLKVTLDNVKLTAPDYALNLTGGSGIAIVIKDSEIKGWAAINSFASDSTFAITNSTLHGYNDTTLSKWHNFATISLDGNTGAGRNNTVTIHDSQIVSESPTGNIENWVWPHNGSVGNTIIVTGNSSLVNANAENDILNFYFAETDLTSSITVPASMLEGIDDVDGKLREKLTTRTDNGDGTYTIRVFQPVAQILMPTTVFYETFEAAVAAADAAVEAGEDDPAIYVVRIPDGTLPPTGWAFVTDGDLTTLERAVAQVVTDNGDGTVTTNEQFAAIQDAIDAAGENGYGTTVEVIRDVQVDGLTIKKSITLTGAVDENGKPVRTITGVEDMTSADYADIYVSEDSAAVAVTISNLKLRNFGDEATADGSSVVTFDAYEADSTLTVTNLDIAAYNQYAVATLGDGTLAVQGCTIDGTASDTRDMGGVYAKNGAATVSGGTIKNVAVGIDADDAAVAIANATVTANADGTAIASSAGAAVTVDGGDYAGELDVDEYSTLTVESGHFDRYVDETYCGDGKIAVPWAAGAEGWYEVVPGSFVATVTHEGTVTPYASLKAAVDAAADGDTVTLLADDTSLSDGSELVIDKSITITGAVDANSEPLYTIHGKKTQAGANDIFITGSGNVTISNVKVAEFGCDVGTDPSHAPIYVSTHFTGTVNLDNVQVSGFNRGGVFLYGGTFNVTNCYIDCANSRSGAFTKGIEIKGSAHGTIVDTTIVNMERASAAASTAGIEIYGSGSIVVDGCTILSDIDPHASVKATYGIVSSRVGVHDPSGGSLLVTNCVISTSNGCLSISDNDEYGPVNGYSITVTESSFDNYIGLWSAGSSVMITSGDYAEDVYVDAGTATITGGNFTHFAPYAETGATIAISGGTFDTPVPEEYCAEGYIPATLDAVTGIYSVKEGAYVVRNTITDQGYETLEEALAEIDEDEDVTLLDNVTLTDDVTLALTGAISITLDGKTLTANGHTITIPAGLEVIVDEQKPSLFVAPAKYVIDESEDEGLYTYTPVKIVAMIEDTPYTNFVDAVTAYQDGDTITVVDYDDQTMVAPEDWKFVSDGAEPPTWTLVQKDYKVTVTDGTTTKQFETIAAAATYVNAQPAGDYTVTIAAGTFDETATFAQDKTKTRNVTVTGTTDDSGNLLTIVTGGQFKIDATAGDMGTAVGSLTFEKIKFDFSGADAARDTPIINSNDQNRYPSNITIDGCEFVGNGAKVFAAIQLKQPYNVVIRDSKFTGGLHSAMQISTCGQGITIDGCEVTDCKNGFSLKTSGKPWNEPITDIVITDTTVSATGYGFRFDANTYERNVTFTGCTVSAEQPIVLRKTTTSTSTVAVTGCTMTPTGTYPWCTVTSGDDGEAAVAPTATLVTITTDLTDAPSIMAGKVGDTYWWPLAKALEAAEGSPLEVTLAMDGNAEDLTLPAAASLKLVKDGNVFAGTVTAEDGATLTLTETSEYYLWEPTVTQLVYPIEGTAGLPIATQWLIDNSIDGYTGGPLTVSVTNGLVTALTENGANGMPRWESYVLGLNPADATATLRLTAAPVDGDATKVKITGVNVVVTSDGVAENVSVTFRLAERNDDDGTWTDIEADKETPVFTVPLADVSGKVLAIFADIVVE